MKKYLQQPQKYVAHDFSAIAAAKGGSLRTRFFTLLGDMWRSLFNPMANCIVLTRIQPNPGAAKAAIDVAAFHSLGLEDFPTNWAASGAAAPGV